MIDGQCDLLGIAADANYVYWANGSQGMAAVSFVPVTGSGGSFPGFGGSPIGVAIDAVNLYWTDSQAGTVTQYPVYNTVLNQVTLAQGLPTPAGIAVDSNIVYWTTLAGPDGGGTVMSTPVATASVAGSVTTLATGQALPFGIAVANGNVYWQNLGTPPSYQDGTISTMPVDGSSPPTILATGQASPVGRSEGPVGMLAVDANNVYWVANGQVMWLPLKGGTTPIPFGVGDGGIAQGLAIDASNLYVTAGSTVLTTPLPPGSGATVTLAAKQTSPGAIAAGPGGVYWGSASVKQPCSPIWSVPLP